MPETDDKMGKAMADAMGVDFVPTDDQGQDIKKDDQNSDTDNKDQNQDNNDQNQDQSQDQNKSDDKGDDKGDDQNADNSDSNSSGDQSGDDGKGSDQASDTKVIPDSSKSDDGAGQGTDFDKMLSERSGGRFTNIADIDKALEEAPQNAFANEQVAKLNEYVKGGGKLEDFVRTQTVDYGQMSPEQLVFSQMQLNDPDMSAEEIQLLMEEDFGVAEDATERQKQVAAAKLKRASREALKELQADQQKWATPKPDSAVDQAKAQKQWETQLNTASENVKDIEIALNQTDNFNFKVEAEAISKVKETYGKTPQAFFSRYINADGSENTEQFIQDMVKLENFDAIVRAAASNSKNAGKKDVVDDLKNSNFDAKNKKDGDDAPKGIEDQAAAQFFKHNPMR
jgi:hypothetical protein